MKGSIIDYRVKIKPSKKLLDFITKLDDEKSMPENILKIFKLHSYDDDDDGLKTKTISSDPIQTKPLNKDQLKFLHELELNENDFKTLQITNNDDHLFSSNISATKLETDDCDDTDKSNTQKNLPEEQINNDDKTENDQNQLYLHFNDVKWIKNILDNKRNQNENVEYLHELMEDCKLILPENEIIPRNPELEARCQKLKADLFTKEYQQMTKNVDTTKKFTPEESIAYQLKSLNRQLIAVLQFVFSIATGFAFGFIGVELIIGNLDFGFRLLLGVMCALIIALAEIYFLAKKLNEYDVTTPTTTTT